MLSIKIVVLFANLQLNIAKIGYCECEEQYEVKYGFVGVGKVKSIV